MGELGIAGILYLVPSIVAFGRRHPDRWAIFLINTLLGATGIGWLGAMIWALTAIDRGSAADGASSLEGVDFMIRRLPPPPPPPPPFIAFPPPPPTFDELTGRLLRLKDLFDAGAISEGEYTAMREAILRRI